MLRIWAPIASVLPPAPAQKSATISLRLASSSSASSCEPRPAPRCCRPWNSGSCCSYQTCPAGAGPRGRITTWARTRCRRRRVLLHRGALGLEQVDAQVERRRLLERARQRVELVTGLITGSSQQSVAAGGRLVGGRIRSSVRQASSQASSSGRRGLGQESRLVSQRQQPERALPWRRAGAGLRPGGRADFCTTAGTALGAGCFLEQPFRSSSFRAAAREPRRRARTLAQTSCAARGSTGSRWRRRDGKVRICPISSAQWSKQRLSGAWSGLSAMLAT